MIKSIQKSILAVTLCANISTPLSAGENHLSVISLKGTVEQGYANALNKILINAKNMGSTFNINELDKQGALLHYAVWFKQAGIIPVLLSHGAHVNIKTPAGATPLHLAALNNNIEATKELLKSSQIQVDAVDIYGKTALMEAVWKEHHEIAQLILEKKGIFGRSAQNEAKKTALSTYYKIQLSLDVQEENREWLLNHMKQSYQQRLNNLN